MLELENKLNTLEQKYGGLVKGVIRTIKSPDEKKGYWTKHQGGDRMNSKCHNYSKIYAKYLADKLESPINIAEVGILTGIGMAIWCDIFKNATVYGLDIDINIFNKNKPNLEKLGAFKNKSPIINSFDQFKDNKAYLSEITKLNTNKKFSIVIDDGCHLSSAILKCFESFLPHLDENFVYFIEDNRDVHKIIKKKYPNYNIFYSKQMTVITPK